MSGVEQAAPNARVEFEGEQRALVYTMHALAQVERLTGKNLMKGQLETDKPTDLIILLWAGLLEACTDLDGDIIDGKPDDSIQRALKRVGKSMTLPKIKTIGEAVNLAFLQSGGETKGKKGEGSQ